MTMNKTRRMQLETLRRRLVNQSIFLPFVITSLTYFMSYHLAVKKLLSSSFSCVRLSASRTFLRNSQYLYSTKRILCERKLLPLVNFSANSSVIASNNRTQFRSLSTISMSPTGVVENFSYNLPSDELLKKTESLITECRKLYDKVAGVADSDVSCETVIKVLNEAEILLGTKRFFLEFGQYVSLDANIRNASTEADRKLREFCVEISMRKDVFEKLLVLQKKGESMNPLAKRCLEKLIRIGKRNGLHLDENTQKKTKELTSKMNNLSIDFTKNLNEVTTTLEFSKEELDGLPEDFFESLKKISDSEKYEVTLKYPHYFPIMEKCKVPETRKRLEFAFNTQCLDENIRILTELRKLRHEVAILLGYPNHAAYRLEVLMAKSPETVNKFLSELADKLTPLWIEEKKYLLELKEKECSDLGKPFDGKLNSWDTTYYLTKAKEIKYAVDKSKLREYFPFPVVKEGLLKIYQNLLGLKFELVQGDTWHEDVEMYSVTDANDGNLLGYFYLDLYPRPNKYGHAACFELQHGIRLSDGTRQPGVAAMVANFTKPKKDFPALMDVDEVVTFFHEFGHVMHYLCVDTEYGLFSSFQVEKDFVEAPSQMLENWCWEKEPLRKMSSHYINKSEIPEDILNALLKSRNANVGNFNLRQIVLASYDQLIHSSPEGDTTEMFYEQMKKIVGIEPQEGTSFPCHFGHLAGEYDSQYYGYLWSEVYSMDMYQTRFGAGNVFNPQVGQEYRNKILKPGATQDAYDLVCNFLGREPTQEAFLRSKGLKI